MRLEGHIRRTLRPAPIVAAAVFAGALLAGDWHSGERLDCSDCHTMHNSSAGQPMRYDVDPTPARNLLRHATSLTLCVYCHDGSNELAPDVIAPVSYVEESSAGAFANPGGQPATGKGHALAAPTPLTPPGGSEAMTLTCITCHEPHGSGSYRNLKLSPFGTATLPVFAAQGVRADGTNPASVYVPANVTHTSGTSAWCGACHGAFHGRSAGEEGTGSPWLRHPLDQTIATSPNADYGFWSGAIARRVPVESPIDTGVPSADDRVFCLSCHKAHGSPNKAATIFADGVTLTSTCQQCHDQ